MTKGKIICGFAGIGKSTYAKQTPGVVDLESTPFEKNWKTYIKVAKHMADNGYTVLMSCHKELRERLYEQNIEYILAMPSYFAKDEYIRRYKERGDTESFIKLLSNNWDNYQELLPHETEKNNVLVVSKYLNEINRGKEL